MNKRRLTFRRYFDKYKPYDLITSIRLNNTYCEGEEENVVIVETDETMYDDGRTRIVKTQAPSHFLVGEVANRLYEYEQLGYSPEELKEIIDGYKKYRYKERLNSIYGVDAFDGDVESLYPRLFVARGNGKSFEQAKTMLVHAEFERIMNKKIAECRERNITPLRKPNLPEIQNVIFNDPATIIFWKDGTKTVVKADNEEFDPEKGLAMAISKKALGNKGNYFDIFKKWAGKLAKEYADMRARKKQEEHEPKWLAEQRLHNALHDKKATKADLLAAMQDAITYLNNEKEN